MGNWLHPIIQRRNKRNRGVHSEARVRGAEIEMADTSVWTAHNINLMAIATNQTLGRRFFFC